MTLIPQFRADIDEYPELITLAPEAMSRIAELMGIHAIAELRRLHKTGVFDRPYTKDIVVPIDIPVVPDAVQACRHAAGKALLDYMETIGLTGLRLSNFSKEDGEALTSLWVKREQQAPACSVPANPEKAPDNNAGAPEKTESPDQPDEPVPNSTDNDATDKTKEA